MKFGIKFQTAELESLQTVGHLAGLVQSELRPRAVDVLTPSSALQ